MTTIPARLALGAPLVLLMLAVASAQAADAGSDRGPADAGSRSDRGTDAAAPFGDTGPAGDAGSAEPPARAAFTSPTCTERLPESKARPKVTEAFPDKVKSGYAVGLELTIEHGKGETVLPTGFELGVSTPERRALERAGFRLPHPDGGAGPSIVRGASKGETATTRVTLPLLVLPEKPGRQELTLPPLPIAIARASGDVISICTGEHSLVVEDPIAETPNPLPRENLEGRRQLEEWTAAKHVTIASLVALVVGALLAWLIAWWRRRPKPVPPPPPPRPPWEVALEALSRIRGADLIRAGRFAEHFDQVSDAVRKYLGDQYGFDGLESTTREALLRLSRVAPPLPELPEIEDFLRGADLVKFARLTPSAEDCERALERAERIVRSTMTLALRAAPALSAGQDRPTDDGSLPSPEAAAHPEPSSAPTEAETKVETPENPDVPSGAKQGDG